MSDNNNTKQTTAVLIAKPIIKVELRPNKILSESTDPKNNKEK